MCSCGKVNSVQRTYSPPPVVIVNKDCFVTKQKIETIYNRLLCLKNSGTSNINSYIGKIITMINLKDYCKYDISDILNFLNSTNC
jgi:hypothetical protein